MGEKKNTKVQIHKFPSHNELVFSSTREFVPNQTNPVSIKISAFLLLQERNTFNNKRAYKKQNSKSKVAVISLPTTRYAISQAVTKSI